jgi:site-specific DNA recombinase
VRLGYNVENKRLAINPQEADRVRHIFRRYLELGCLTKLAGDLRKRGIFSKLTRRSNSTARGGIPFTKGPLAYLLKNRVYIGDIIHKGQYYPGEHEPIIDRELRAPHGAQHAIPARLPNARALGSAPSA